MAKKPEPLTGEEELQNVLRMNAYLGCTGTHRTASGRLMPCASPESLARISNRAEPEKKGSRKKRRTRFEKLRERGVRGIDTLPGGGLVSAPIIIKVAKDSPRAKRRKARSDREAATPAPLKDRIVGSSKNPRGTARSVSSASNIEMTAAVEQALKNKVNQHNEKMRSSGKPDSTLASLRALKSVYRRGAGAFSVSHRPGKTRGQWAMARVNAFLYLLEKGRPRNARYVTDNDLLPIGHPKSTKWMFIDPELKILGRRGLRRVVPFIRNARDADRDGVVQEGTIHERAANLVPDLFEGSGLPKGRTSPRAMSNRLKEIEDRVAARFGVLETRRDAVNALGEAFSYADVDGLLLSDRLTDAEKGAVTGLLDLSMTYPKTAEMIDEISTNLNLGQSGRFSSKTGFTDVGSTVINSNHLYFGRTFDDFVQVQKQGAANRLFKDPEATRFFSVPQEVASTEGLDDQAKNRLTALALVAHEFGHAWHERATKPNSVDDEEHDPVDYFAALMRTDPDEFQQYVMNAFKQFGNKIPVKPNLAGLSESEASESLAKYNKKRKKLISDAITQAVENISKERGVRLTDYRDDGLSKTEITEMFISTTVSDYGSQDLMESFAENFTADYLGMTHNKPIHMDKLWNFLNQTKTDDQTVVKPLHDGVTVEIDSEGNVTFVDQLCRGLEE